MISNALFITIVGMGGVFTFLMIMIIAMTFLRFLSRAKNDWTAQNWLTYYGQPETSENIGIPNTLHINGKRISFHSKTCPNADLCLLPHPHPKEKNAFSLFENGVRLFYIDSEKIRIKKIAF